MSGSPVEDCTGIERWLEEVVEALLHLERPVPLFELMQKLSMLGALPTPDLTQLLTLLRTQGYLRRALVVAEELDRRAGGTSSGYGPALRAELAVLSGTVDAHPSPISGAYVARPRRILIVAEGTLRDIDSGQAPYLHAFAQRAGSIGVQIAVVGPMGYGNSEGYEVEEVDGVQYHRIPGPSRESIHIDDWLTLFVTRLSAVVRKVRPASILASGDLLNGLAAVAVCRDYGLPFVYDFRDPKQNTMLAPPEIDSSPQSMSSERWGEPDTRALRHEREAALARDADAVLAASTQVRGELTALGVTAERIFEIGDAEQDVASWVGLLEAVGVLDSGHSEILRVVFDPPAVDEVRNKIGTLKRTALDRIAELNGYGTIRSIREEGWRHSSLEPLQITATLDWIGACRANRSQASSLHAWDFMVPFLKSWDRDRDRGSLTWCLERATSWCATFNAESGRGTMAWYDMAIGKRAPRLAYLLQEAVHEGETDAVIDILARAVLRHQQELYADAAFNARTNHGFYTAVGQLSFARRLLAMPAMALLESQGLQRLKTVVATQFGTDGGHLEHSPYYHRLLLSSFRDAMDDGLLDDPDVAERITRAAEVMGWFIQPDGRIVQIGDSPAKPVPPGDRAATAPHTQFLASAGRAGDPNPRELLVLPNSGYAFVRSPQPKSHDDHLRAGYLTFMAGFHSRAHKHCDDLSVTWFDRGQELLIDSGRFGYLDPLPADSPERSKGFFYGRPERQYVESVRAHNTVQINDEEHDRRRPPYGSGLSGGEERDGYFQLSGSVDHGTWVHSRTITYLPGTWLLVDDAVRSKTAQEQSFTVWWNLTAALDEPSTVRSNVVRFGLADRSAHLHVVSLSADTTVEPAIGQQRPLRGWRAALDYEFTPSWSMGHRATATLDHTFQTLLTFEADQQTRPSTPFDV